MASLHSVVFIQTLRIGACCVYVIADLCLFLMQATWYKRGNNRLYSCGVLYCNRNACPGCPHQLTRRPRNHSTWFMQSELHHCMDLRTRMPSPSSSRHRHRAIVIAIAPSPSLSPSPSPSPSHCIALRSFGMGVFPQTVLKCL